MARIIAVANQKGGVGKTTTVVNLGAALAERGKHTLLVDLDSQAALTSAYGIGPKLLASSVYEVLLAQELEVERAILNDIRPNLDLLPANVDLAGAEVELVSQLGREYLLHEALVTISDDYDYILIDCGPSLGLLTVNALSAADEVLIPLLCEFLALRGMGMLFDTIRRVREHTNPGLHILGIVVTMYDNRTLHGREVMDEVREMFGDYVFDMPVDKSIRFSEAVTAQMPIIEYDPEHNGADAYRTLAQEMINGQS